MVWDFKCAKCGKLLNYFVIMKVPTELKYKEKGHDKYHTIMTEKPFCGHGCAHDYADEHLIRKGTLSEMYY